MKYSRKFVPLVLGTCLVLATSCGSDDDDSSPNTPQSEQQQDQGVYSATLTTLNAGVGGNAALGNAEITISGDEVKVTLDMQGTPASMVHVQHIHTADACPTLAQDTNSDGFLDVLEGVPSYGPILVPLDGDLNSQAGGASGFPSADSSGAYSYSENATLSMMLDDLRMPDTDTEDATVKLPEGENLNLEGRHIVIHGVPADTELPDTVGTLGDAPAQATLPIACGEIVRVSDAPDTTTTGATTGDATADTTTGTTGGDATGTATGTVGGTASGTASDTSGDSTTGTTGGTASGTATGSVGGTAGGTATGGFMPTSLSSNGL